MARRIGTPLMPWQAQVADVAGELVELENGLLVPAYREVDITVPRQSGKTALLLAMQVHRCLSPRWRHPQRSLFTAHTGRDARAKWLEELVPQLEGSPIAPALTGVSRANGNEGVSFATKSLIGILSTSAGVGHGRTVHQAVLDEIWHDVDDRREQGLRPAMVTVRDAQLLVCSTAGTAASTVLNRKVARGRRAATELDHGIAFFEWSAPDEEAVFDPERWGEFMPALGHTINHEVIEAEMAAMPEGEFRRAYGNLPTPGADLVIPEAVWNRVCDPTLTPTGELTFGLDVDEDRGRASIVAFGAGVFELLERRDGTGWAARRANELTARHGGEVAFDAGGPAGALAADLDRPRPFSGRDVSEACARLYDAIVEETVRFRRHDGFDAAVRGAVKRQSGDTWAWSRRASIDDVTPLVAATMALAGAGAGPPPIEESVW